MHKQWGGDRRRLIEAFGYYKHKQEGLNPHKHIKIVPCFKQIECVVLSELSASTSTSKKGHHSRQYVKVVRRYKHNQGAGYPPPVEPQKWWNMTSLGNILHNRQNEWRLRQCKRPCRTKPNFIPISDARLFKKWKPKNVCTEPCLVFDHFRAHTSFLCR